MALLGGADAVLELPSCWACGSAEYFSKGAVGILDALDCVDHLCFGSESGDVVSCQKLGQVLDKEPEEFQNFLRDSLKEGLPFPAARKSALKKYLEARHDQSFSGDALFSGIENLLDSPNNLLGIEYCKALSRLNSRISPVTVKEKGPDITTKASLSPFPAPPLSVGSLLVKIRGYAFRKTSGLYPAGFCGCFYKRFTVLGPSCNGR